MPGELADLCGERYRQLISSKNRVIHEPATGSIYIHISCDVRRDLRGLLNRHLLRVVR